MDQLGLQFLQPRLGLLVFGKVAHEAGKVGRATGLHFADRQMHRKRRSVPALAGHDPSNADDMPLAGGPVTRKIAVMTRPIRGRASVR